MNKKYGEINKKEIVCRLKNARGQEKVILHEKLLDRLNWK